MTEEWRKLHNKELLCILCTNRWSNEGEMSM